MPIDVGDLLTKRSALVSQTSAFAWLIDAQVDASEAFRLTSYDQEIVFDGNTYFPYPFEFTTMKRDASGAISDVSVTVSNVAGLMMASLESGGILSKRAILTLVHVDNLTPVDNKREEEYVLKTAQVSETTATFTLSMTNPLSIAYPSERVNRGTCRYLKEYGVLRCAYDRTLANLIAAQNPDFDPTTCAGTRGSGGDTSGNSCAAHGDNEVANGIPRLHPLRYGAFPGVAKGQIVGG